MLRHAAWSLRQDSALCEQVALSLGLSPAEAREWLDADLFCLEQALEMLREGAQGPSRGIGVFVAHWSDGIGRLGARLARSILAGEPLILLGDPRLPWGAQALAKNLFMAGLDDNALALLWDDTWTLRRCALGDPRCSWYRSAGTGMDLERTRQHARAGLELGLWEMRNRSLALPDDFEPAQAAESVLEQAVGRAVTLSGQAPGQVARVACPERRFAAFTEALLARLEQFDPRSPMRGLEPDFSSDLEAAWQLALDEGASPIHGEPGGLLPLVVTNVDCRQRLVRERRPRPMLSLIRTPNAAAATELCFQLDAAVDS